MIVIKIRKQYFCPILPAHLTACGMAVAGNIVGGGIGRGHDIPSSQGVAALHPGLPSPSALTGWLGIGAVPQIRYENRGRRTGRIQIRYDFPQSVSDTGFGRPLGLPGSVTQTGATRGSHAVRCAGKRPYLSNHFNNFIFHAPALPV